MKKLQLVELGVISVVLIIGYNMITTLFSIITSLLFSFGTTSGENILFIFLPAILFFAFYTITFFILGRNITRIAKFFCRQSNDLLEFNLNKAAVLHVIIIAVCLGSFLRTIPYMLDYFIKKFIIYKDENYEDVELAIWYKTETSFWNSLIGFILALVLLLLAKRIADLLGKEKQTFEINDEKIESNI